MKVLTITLQFAAFALRHPIVPARRRPLAPAGILAAAMTVVLGFTNAPLLPAQARPEICGLRTMPKLADFLTNAAGRPVFDKTDIQGDYDLLLTFDIYEARNQIAPPDYNKPQLAIALQEQLGLRLESRKASLTVLVIESINRPTGN